MPYVQQCDNDPFIKYKRNDHKTLKTVVFPAHPTKRVELEKVIEAAVKVAEDLYCLKYIELKGIGSQHIDTTVIINYYGVHFSVNEETTLEEAKTAYRLAENNMRPAYRRLRTVS